MNDLKVVSIDTIKSTEPHVDNINSAVLATDNTTPEGGSYLPQATDESVMTDKTKTTTIKFADDEMLENRTLVEVLYVSFFVVLNQMLISSVQYHYAGNLHYGKGSSFSGEISVRTKQCCTIM